MISDTQHEAAIEAAEKYRDGPNREGDAFVAGYLAAYDAARSGEAEGERELWTGKRLFDYLLHEAERARNPFGRLSSSGKVKWDALAARIEREIANAAGKRKWLVGCPYCHDNHWEDHVCIERKRAEHPETGEREAAELAEADLPDADTAAAEYEETKRRVIAGKASAYEAQEFIDFIEGAIPNHPPAPLHDGGEGDGDAFVVCAVPARAVQQRDVIVTASALGSVRKTVFSIIDGGEEGICLNFTDADALRLPIRDALVLRVEPDESALAQPLSEWSCACGVRNSHHRATCIGCHQQRYTPPAPQQVIFDRGTGATLATATREGIEMLRDCGVIEAVPWPNAGLERWVLAEGVDAGDLMQLLIHPPSRGSAQ